MYLRFITAFGLVLCLLAPAPSVHAMVTEDDADGDGIPNFEEDLNRNGIVDVGETDPFNADTDHGGESDSAELERGTDPRVQVDDYTYDRDGDGLTNGEEIEIYGTNPEIYDSDNDGVNDKDDPFPKDASYHQDSDNDGIPDEYERAHNFNVYKKDGTSDADNDGLDNKGEFEQQTDPHNPDSDHDGEEDGAEVERGTNPNQSPCLMYSAEEVTTLSDIHGHWAANYIQGLQKTKILPQHQRLVEGYQQDGKRYYRPDRPISRFELLKLALLSSCIRLQEGRDRGAFQFTDVSGTPEPLELPDAVQKRRIIYTAYDYNIVKGYPDGTFKPDKEISRAEAVKILFAASKLQPREQTGIKDPFPDVPQGQWFSAYIRQALSYEIISGYPDGYFRPHKNITRAEAAKVISLLMRINPRVNGEDLPAS